MASNSPLLTSHSDLLRWFLSLFSLSQVTMLWDLYQIGKQWWPGRADIYEILDYEANVELLDPQGEKAIFRKRQKVKFLHPTNKQPRMRRRLGKNGSQSLIRPTFFSGVAFAY